MITTNINFKNMIFKHNPELRDVARPSTALVREMIRTANYFLDLLQRTHNGSQWGLDSSLKEINGYAERALMTLYTLYKVDYITVESYAALTEEIRVARDEAVARRKARR